MSSKTKSSPTRLSIPRNNSRGMKPQHNSHAPSTHEFVNLPSGMSQDNEYSQDMLSLSPDIHGQNAFGSISHWALNDPMLLGSDLSSASECTEGSFDPKSPPTTDYDAPDSKMLSFPSFSQSLFPGSTGPGHQSEHSVLSELSRVSGAGSSPQMVLSNPQGYQAATTAPLGFPLDHETKHMGGTSSCPMGDRDAMAFDSHPGDSFSGWNHGPDMSNGGVTQMSNIFNPLPATPPHTEGGNDVSVSSGCSQTSYHSSFMPSEDPMFVDVSDNSSLSTQNFSLGEPYYPLTPPLSEQDPNRTIRPQKQQRRPIISSASSQQPENNLSATESLGQRVKDAPEPRNPRDNPYYSQPTKSDGKYHCPFSVGEKPCAHTPTTQKCAYHKYLDSHLKPYRCRIPECVDAHFSSNACLFRHEREAHGMHGHGENPHLCLFTACERSMPGNGFPRRWNLHDHMRRVHDYATSEKGSSPEGSPVVSGQPSKKKETGARRRKGSRVTGAQPMKRARSTQSQTSTAKAAQVQANTGQQLHKAEQSYYSCLTRLQGDLNKLNPQDPALHDKANASLQELHTLALNYRYIRAGQLAQDAYPS